MLKTVQIEESSRVENFPNDSEPTVEFKIRRCSVPLPTIRPSCHLLENRSFLIRPSRIAGRVWNRWSRLLSVMAISPYQCPGGKNLSFPPMLRPGALVDRVLLTPLEKIEYNFREVRTSALPGNYLLACGRAASSLALVMRAMKRGSLRRDFRSSSAAMIVAGCGPRSCAFRR